uniref:Uncharacterized protein n=1 Tax=Panagrolaimus davidi TaxID=227884 RepID=A0A914Q1R2_9BILA
MCANDLRKSDGENGASFGVPVKEMDRHTHALYRAQFLLKFENGNGKIHAKIQREENFETIPVNEISYNYIVDGTARLYGNLIPSEVVADIISKNGWIKIIADLDIEDENSPAIHFPEPVDVEEEDDENDRENYLPNFDDAEHVEHIDLPDIF